MAAAGPGAVSPPRCRDPGARTGFEFSGLLLYRPRLPQILTLFLVLSLTLNLSSSWARGYLHRTNRRGLLAAVNKMLEELTTLGFISLILLSLQTIIAKICGARAGRPAGRPHVAGVSLFPVL